MMGKQPKKAIAEERSTEGTGTVYQLKITLKEVRPPIWRRVLLPPEISLERLHQVIQTVMGWTNSHLHNFIVDGVSYGDTSVDTESDMENEKKYKLTQVVTGEKFKFGYIYDWGDYWVHEILVEKIVAHPEPMAYPICLAGKRACPPEDCGGISGYEELLEILGDPSHPDHEDTFNWLPGDFDSEKFDMEFVNRALSPKVKKPKKTWVKKRS
jgi:hypothetical protein